MATITISDIRSGVSSVSTALNSNIASYGASSFTTTALSKNGGSSMFCIGIDGAKIGGTINSVKISYKAYGSRTGVLGAKASIRTGYINSSSTYVEVNSHGDVGRGSSNATSYTDPITNPYNDRGYCTLFFKCINNIASQTNTVYVSNISIVIDYTPITYTISTQASPAEGGVVTGGGTYSSGATVNLTAAANDGYEFVKWSDGGTSTSKIFQALSNATYIAYFERTAINNVRIGASKLTGIYYNESTKTVTFVIDDAVSVPPPSGADTWDSYHIEVSNTIPSGSVPAKGIQLGTTYVFTT